MTASVLVVDDEETARLVVSDFLAHQGYEVQGAGTLAEARRLINAGAPDIIVLDVRLPDGHGPNLINETQRLTIRPQVIIITAHGDVSMAVEAMRSGAHDFIEKPLDLLNLAASVKRAAEVVAMRRELNHFRSAQSANGEFIIGKTAEMQEVVRLATRAAELSVSVLITGPTGTGKEVLARYIHRSGPRKDKPFIDINCPAIQSTMFESEIFGHEAGAFTGAVKKHNGLMEIADGGVLFLDEIASMPVDMQAKLLRAIEERSFRRVGGSTLIPVDVQLVAASNRNLKEMILTGEFREDLYYRLKVVDLNLPSLASRKEDIADLVGYFVRKFNSKRGLNIQEFSPAALSALRQYDWPGNIRELSNTVERAMLFCDGPVVGLENLPRELTTAV